jgi:hypothetical protein
VLRLFIIEAKAEDNDSSEGEAITNEDDDTRNLTISLHAYDESCIRFLFLVVLV